MVGTLTSPHIWWLGILWQLKIEVVEGFLCQPFFVWYFWTWNSFWDPASFLNSPGAFFKIKQYKHFIKDIHTSLYIYIYTYFFKHTYIHDYTTIFAGFHHLVSNLFPWHQPGFHSHLAPTNSWGATGRLRPKWLGTSGARMSRWKFGSVGYNPNKTPFVSSL